MIMNFENIDVFLDSDREVVDCDVHLDNRWNSVSPVCCEHPSILFNPNWYDLFMKYGSMRWKDKVIKYQNYTDLTVDELRKLIYMDFRYDITNYSQLVIPRSGKPDFQVLMCVPCGRCSLCRTNKSNEYAFRSVCETAVYPDNPLFITLTYRDEYLPLLGLDITDFQKFMKKLRFHLSECREMKDQPPAHLRYLAVGEYGSKGGRPHFHLILWNMPVDRFRDSSGNIIYSRLYSPIYKAWLRYVLDDNGKRQYFEFKSGRRVPRMQCTGMVKILPVQDGCTSYITKYFRKDPVNKKGYPGKPFLCSSRKNGGIGSAFIRSKRDFVLKNRFSANLKIFVYDSISGKYFSRGISNYIKNVLFPSKSVVYNNKKYHYEMIKKIQVKFEQMMAAVLYLRKKHSFFFDLHERGKSLISKLRDFLCLKHHTYYLQHYSFYRSLHQVDLILEIKHLIAEIDMLYSLLDTVFIENSRKAIYERSLFMSAREQVRVPVTYNVCAHKDKYEYNYKNYLQRCIF